MFITKEGVLGATCVYYGRSFGSSTCSFRREFWEQHVFIITERVLEHVFIITEGVSGAARVYYGGSSGGARFYYGGSLRAARV